MKNKLIELAKKKGFVGMLYGMWNNSIKSDKDNYVYYLWLCELQKWLRDKKDIHICIESGWDRMCGYNRGYLLNINGLVIHEDNDVFINYEKALETGCFKSLKLIK